MSTDITPYVNASLDEKRAYAQMLSAAGDLLPRAFMGNIKNPDTGLMEQRMMPGKILMIAETGAMLGIHPMAAIQGIDVVEGNPTIKPSLMSALVREKGFTLRSWTTGTIEGGDIAAHASLVRPDDPDFTYESTWTPYDGIRAGRVDSYLPDNNGVWHVKARSKDDKALPWEAYTKRLLRWRAIGDVCTEGAEDVLLGIHYMPDELTTNITADGDVVQGDIEPTEDWLALIAAEGTRDGLFALAKRIESLGEYTDEIRTAVLKKVGGLKREVVIEETAPEAEPVPETESEPATPTDVDYEAQAAAEAEAGR